MPTYICGATGGYGGHYFDERGAVDASDGARVSRVRVRSRDVVDAIQIFHRRPGEDSKALARHGGDGGSSRSVLLSQGEFLTEVSGTYGDRVDSLRLRTNEGLRLAAGANDGPARFRYQAPPGCEIAGFVGRAATQLDALGVVFRTRRTRVMGSEIVRVGPVAGHGGEAFDDGRDVPDDGEPLRIVATGHYYVESIQLVHRRADGREHALDRHGGDGRDRRQLELGEDEWITRVSGKHGQYVDSLDLITNKGNTLSVGGEPVSPFPTSGAYVFEVPPQCRVVGFFGRAGSYVDALGLILRWRDDYATAPPDGLIRPFQAPPPESTGSSGPATLNGSFVADVESAQGRSVHLLVRGTWLSGDGAIGETQFERVIDGSLARGLASSLSFSVGGLRRGRWQVAIGSDVGQPIACEVSVPPGFIRFRQDAYGRIACEPY